MYGSNINIKLGNTKNTTLGTEVTLLCKSQM